MWQILVIPGLCKSVTEKIRQKERQNYMLYVVLRYEPHLQVTLSRIGSGYKIVQITLLTYNAIVTLHKELVFIVTE